MATSRNQHKKYPHQLQNKKCKSGYFRSLTFITEDGQVGRNMHGEHQPKLHTDKKTKMTRKSQITASFVPKKKKKAKCINGEAVVKPLNSEY
jgi:hypothetical protein